jgi:hypothetical protein
MDAAGSSASAIRTLAIPPSPSEAPTGNRPAPQESSGSSPASSPPVGSAHIGPAQQQALL